MDAWRREMFSKAMLLCVLAVLVFANSFKNDFVGYDDPNLIVNNESIRSLSPENIGRMFSPRHRGNYQPLRTLSYAVDYAIWGPHPFGYHLTNVVMHVVTVLGVWLVVRHLLAEPVALLAAAIFAVHPIHVESVTWMSARKDVLSLAFFLLALLWYERSESSGKTVPYLGSIAATALALLSKLTAVTLPVCIVLLEVCRDGWPNAAGWRRKLVRLTPHALLVLVVVALNFARGTAVRHGDPLAGVEQASHVLIRDIWLSMPLVVCRYVGKLALPFSLSTHYQVTRVSEIADMRFLLPAAAVLALLLCGVICMARSYKVAAFSLWWFVICFLPTSNIIPAAEVMTDRYMHAPSIGFAVLLATALMYPATKLRGGPHVRRWAALPAAAVVLLLSIATVRRNADWRSTTALFKRTLQVNPHSVDARLALGAMYAGDGNYDAAIEMYKESLNLVPRNYRVLYNLGLAYMKKGWFYQAVEALEASRSARPDFLITRFQLALAYHQLGRYDEAIDEHKEVLRLDPQRAESHGDLGRIYLETGREELALEELGRALSLRPDLVPALIDRARCYYRLGRYAAAERDLQRLESLGLDTNELRGTLRSGRTIR